MLFKNFINAIFDQRCLFCRSQELSLPLPFLCSACLSRLEYREKRPDLCPVCGHPRPASQCPSCSELEQIYYDSYQFFNFYQGFYKEVIQKWKKEQYFPLNQLFFYLLKKNNFLKPGIPLTIMPDHFLQTWRKGRRSLKHLLKMLKKDHYPVIDPVFKRKKIWTSQKMKKKTKRILEINTLFYLPPSKINLYSGPVYLIDDIYTTGATANQGARLLKQAGFQSVHLITFYRSTLAESRN